MTAITALNTRALDDDERHIIGLNPNPACPGRYLGDYGSFTCDRLIHAIGGSLNTPELATKRAIAELEDIRDNSKGAQSFVLSRVIRMLENVRADINALAMASMELDDGAESEVTR